MTSQGQDKHTNMTSQLDNKAHKSDKQDTYNIKYIERWMLALRSPSFTQGQRNDVNSVSAVNMGEKLIGGYGDGMEMWCSVNGGGEAGGQGSLLPARWPDVTAITIRRPTAQSLDLLQRKTHCNCSGGGTGAERM